MISRVLLIVCLLASLADARPRKKKRPKAKAKPAATAPTPAAAPAPTPTPTPAPASSPAVVTAPVAPPPAAVARTSKSRIAVVGDPVIAKAFSKALTGNVEVVATGAGAPVALATKHDLHAVIVVSATDGGGLAIVYQGSDGVELGRTEVKAGKFVVGKKLAPEVMAKLGDRLARASAPAGGASVATAETAPSSSTTSSSGASESPSGVTARVSRPQRAQRTIVISVEERPFWRRLRYNDDIDERLRPSDLVANAVGVGASWRPLQSLRNLSIIGRGELAVGVNGSRTSDGTVYSTSSSEWNLGVGFDVGIGAARVGVVATYGEQRFSLDDEAQMMELIPDVTYRFARGGLVVAVPLATRWDLNLSGGWRQLFGMGGMTEAMWFPRASGAGIDGSAGIAFHVTPWLNVEARVDLRRYFFAMNPEPGDPWIAGGATDQYLGGALGLAISPR